MGIVELDLPILRARIILPKRRSSILQRTSQGFDLGTLSLNLTPQHLVAGGQCCSRLVILFELGSDQLHLGAEYPHFAVDVGDRAFKLPLTLQTNLEAKRRVGHERCFPS